MNFAGKVVLITGASSGIGAATAVKFAKYGACLALNGRNVENLKKVAAECSKVSQSQPALVVGDIAKEADTQRIWTETLEKYGKLDVLVNNALQCTYPRSVKAHRHIVWTGIRLRISVVTASLYDNSNR